MMKIIHEIEISIEHATRTSAERILKYLDIETQGFLNLTI